MRHVLDTCVRQLVLRQNYIVAVDRRALIRHGSLFNQCLQRLDLSYNAIFQVDLNFFQLLGKFLQLRELEWQQQMTLNVGRAKILLSEKAEEDKRLYRPAAVSSLVLFPPQFRFMNISGGSFLTGGEIPSKLKFQNATHMHTLDVSYIRIIGCTFVLEGLENLDVFNISGNDCYNMSLTFFDTLPRLKTLAMQKMTFKPGFITNNGKRLLYNLTLLETLDLSHNDLESLPNDLLSRQPALQQLMLSGNNLESLDLDLSFHANLTLLDLSENRLSGLSDLLAIPGTAWLPGNRSNCVSKVTRSHARAPRWVSCAGWAQRGWRWTEAAITRV
jgi:Leucine-rich repeat (LRR) protein